MLPPPPPSELEPDPALSDTSPPCPLKEFLSPAVKLMLPAEFTSNVSGSNTSPKATFASSATPEPTLTNTISIAHH